MSRIISGLLGTTSNSERVLQQYTPAGFVSSGATGSFNRGTNTYTLNRTPERTTAINKAYAAIVALRKRATGD